MRSESFRVTKKYKKMIMFKARAPLGSPRDLNGSAAKEQLPTKRFSSRRGAGTPRTGLRPTVHAYVSCFILSSLFPGETNTETLPGCAAWCARTSARRVAGRCSPSTIRTEWSGPSPVAIPVTDLSCVRLKLVREGRPGGRQLSQSKRVASYERFARTVYRRRARRSEPNRVVAGRSLTDNGRTSDGSGPRVRDHCRRCAYGSMKTTAIATQPIRSESRVPMKYVCFCRFGKCTKILSTLGWFGRRKKSPPSISRKK